jgi:prepilin-type processing-associated H-X9-DG protein
MNHKVNITKKDIAVVLFCIIFLLTSLGAVGSGGRMRAKETVCLSNLRQWGLISQIYTESNDGLFWSGVREGGAGTCYWWPWTLEDRFKDWKKNRIWFCPTAKVPLSQTSKPTIFNAWGIYTESHADSVTGVVYSSDPNGLSGSYGLNGYVLSIPINLSFPSGRPGRDGWRIPVEGGDNIPVFVDCLRFDIWPLDTDSPPPAEYDTWSSNSMARCCVNRHNGAVNVLFMDWSARKVGLKELWKLKWHRSFNTNGPWTTASGVQPNNWPEWMRNFKDF